MRARSDRCQTVLRYALWIPPILLLCNLIPRGVASLLALRGHAKDLEWAVAISPHDPDLYLQLAQQLRADPEQSARRRQLLSRAVALNERHTAARLELAAELEASGEPNRAEAELLTAARFDARFAPQWALANLYVRSGRQSAARATLLSACRLAARHEAAVLDLGVKIGLPGPVLTRCLIDAHADSAARLAVHLARAGDPASTVLTARQLASGGAGTRAAGLLRDLADGLLSRGEVRAATEVWNVGARSGLTREPGTAEWRVLNRVTNRGFGWHNAGVQGVIVSSSGSPEVRLTGDQPEAANLLTQRIGVSGTGCRAMQVLYRTKGLSRASGVHLDVVVPGDPPARLAGLPLPGCDGDCKAAARVCNAARANLLRLVMYYRRSPGETRAQGSISLRVVTFSVESPIHGSE